MVEWVPFLQNARINGILIDSNLLVLLIVGAVNRERIARFKRTSKYTSSDYDLLLGLLSDFPLWCTVPHVLTEVSNLTDLYGPELVSARRLLQQQITVLEEIPVTSSDACGVECYERLGLTDAGIELVAQHRQYSVLTDDFNLYVALQQTGASVGHFTYLRQLL